MDIRVRMQLTSGTCTDLAIVLAAGVARAIVLVAGVALQRSVESYIKRGLHCSVSFNTTITMQF